MTVVRKKILTEEDEAVSPVIATILMVAITVVLAGVLYVWANSLASDQPESGSLNNFNASDATSFTSAATDDTLLRISWTYADEDLNWAFMSFKLEIGDKVFDCEIETNADGADCVIVQNDGNSDTQWETDEIVFIKENGVNICGGQAASTCDIQLTVQYNGQVLSGTNSVAVDNGGSSSSQTTTSNDALEVCSKNNIVITEAHGSGEPEDWLEIHNMGSSACSLEGFEVYDKGLKEDCKEGDPPEKCDEVLTFTSSDSIGAGAYMLFCESVTSGGTGDCANSVTNAAGNTFGFGIKGSGDDIYLLAPDGTTTMYSTSDGDAGSSEWCGGSSGAATSEATPTPGSANSC